jgi:hypothetical protein
MEKSVLDNIGSLSKTIVRYPLCPGLNLPSAKTEKNPVFIQTNFSCKTETFSAQIFWCC